MPERDYGFNKDGSKRGKPGPKPGSQPKAVAKPATTTKPVAEHVAESTNATDDRLYWYAFSFRSGAVDANTYVGLSNPYVTLADITRASQSAFGDAQPRKDRVLMAAVYLGHMTPETFKGQ